MFSLTFRHKIRFLVTDVTKTATQHSSRLALSQQNENFSYSQILDHAHTFAQGLDKAGCRPGDRFCFLVDPGVEFVACLWAGWLRGLIAVPLCVKHPPKEISFVLSNSQPKAVFGCEKWKDKLDEANEEHRIYNVACFQEINGTRRHYDWKATDPALMIYTSGTTGRPKGAVHTAGSLSAQVKMLHHGWQYSSEDVILHW